MNRAFFIWFSVIVLSVTTWTSTGWSYPWMIRHEYTGCATCHEDPSGGFLLTPYGRAQTQTLLSSLGHGPPGDEVDRRSQFLWGAMTLPEFLNVGFSGRYMYSYLKPQGSAGRGKSVWMQADLRGKVTAGDWEMAGSLGYSHEGAQAAFVTSRPKDNLVSREFWVGYAIDTEQKIRLGRMYLPFGLRTIEHYLYVRNVTQTDLDSQQQYGLSYFHQGETFRYEVMAVLGNYQLRPDTYRRRGYSGYFEYVVRPRLAVGVSSLATYQGTDELKEVSGAVLRGAHGAFMRWAPTSDLALMSEWDIVHSIPTSNGDPVWGLVGNVQADWEFVRGLHGVLTPELYVSRLGAATSDTGYRGWLTAAWYAYPHVDLRADTLFAKDPLIGKYAMVLGQIHVSL
ncbi:MAG: hypothetical protein QM784_08220 [Polyangiaceae bacterium]